MVIKGKQTSIILLIAALWIVVTGCGWTGNWFAGLMAGTLLMFLHMVLGSAQKGVVSKKLLLYPLLAWAIVWIVGFVFTQNYAEMFMGQEPTFNILGFHPSFAFIVLFYWIGGVLTLTLGFVKYSEEWLSSDNWDQFIQDIKAIDEKEEVVS